MAEIADRTVVEVRGVAIGQGIPKIIVSLTGASPDELETQLAALADHPIDLVEWRVDRFARHESVAAVLGMLRRIDELLGRHPLLLTVRTASEGGDAALDEAAYTALIDAALDSGDVDIIDVEYRRSDAAQLIASAHDRGVPVIASSHDFAGTPSTEELLARGLAMQELGADILKLAVMPHSTADVLTLLDATRQLRERSIRPLITMAMGPLGAVTRIAGGEFGSAATFGRLGAESAPGQLPVDGLRAALELLDSRD
jgi:3-dehydroquinate dehydratase I